MDVDVVVPLVSDVVDEAGAAELSFDPAASDDELGFELE